MKKTIAIAAVALAISAFASPRAPFNVRRHHTPPPMHIQASRPAPRPMPRPVVHHLAPHHSHSAWGPGGRNFWPGFAGGVISSAILMPPAPVLTPPLPRPHVFAVWVEPVVEIRPVYDIYGNIIRYDQVVIRAGYWR